MSYKTKSNDYALIRINLCEGRYTLYFELYEGRIIIAQFALDLFSRLHRRGPTSGRRKLGYYLAWRCKCRIFLYSTTYRIVLWCWLIINPTIVGIIFSIKHGDFAQLDQSFQSHHRIPTPLKLIILGCLVEVFSGQFDNWWHSNFGFDGLLSPPHLMLISGMLLSIIGALIGTHLSESKTKFKVVSEMIALWNSLDGPRQFCFYVHASLF